MTATLKRATFETSRLMEFFSERELTMQIGHDRDWWPAALLKELLDNALDACETAGVAPEIKVMVTDDSVTVTDNGPGIPTETIARSLDYLVRVSDKQHYVAPTRGQQGNALKTVYAAPYVVDGDRGHVEIISGETHHDIIVTLDRLTDRPQLVHEVSENGAVVKSGTSVKLDYPEIAGYLEGPECELFGSMLVAGFAAFNPHATFSFQIGDKDERWFPSTVSGWRKWKPTDPTSPHWYTPESLRDLIAAYLTSDGTKSRTVREFVSEFAGLSGSAKQKAVTTIAGMTGASLSDLCADGDVDLHCVTALLAAMQRESRALNPAALGVLTKEHFTAHMVECRHVVADSVRYKKVEGTAGGLPFVLEVAFGIRDTDIAQRDVAVGLNFSATLKQPLLSLERLLGQQRIDAHDPVVVLVHLACPVMQFTDRGKGVLELSAEVWTALETAVTSVSRDWKQAKRRADKQDRVQRRALERMRGAYLPPPSIKDAAFRAMEAAYMAASAGGTLPANARQIMYAARPLVLEATGGSCWKESSYFTQTVLPEYMELYPARVQDWNVVYDARGHFQEPHGGRRVDLGTLDVRRYIDSWLQPDGDHLHASTLLSKSFPTSRPDNRYHFALFIEKEGFNELLAAARIAERFDIAIMSTKGMSSTAARLLVEKLSDRGVTILVVHDFDKAGFSIVATLRTSTRRYRFATTPNVLDIGLRLADVQAMELASEPVTYGKDTDPRDNLYENGATAEEIAFLVRGRTYGAWGDWRGERVELNAMMADQFISWLEGKLLAAGVAKVVPCAEVLDRAYRRATRLAVVEKAIKTALADMNGHDIKVPDDLAADVTERIADSGDSWDDAVWEIVQEGAP